MPLKYADPNQVKVEAYQYYQQCIDRYARTKHNKDYIELVRARKDYTNKSQYARNHHPDILNPDQQDLSEFISNQANQIITLTNKIARLRRALSIANKQLALPVDKRDPEVITNLVTLESNP